jgi:hypothetical protein
VVESVQPDQQFGVDHRLDEAVALGPTETRIRWRHFGKQLALGIEEPQDLIGHGVRQDAVDQTDRLKCANRLVVEPDAARVVDKGVALLDHQRANALQAKDVRERQPDGAGPDDDDIDLASHV